MKVVTPSYVKVNMAKVLDAALAMAQAILCDLDPKFRELAYLKVVQITDCHVGKFVHEDYLRKAAEMANSLNADIHLLTGDLIDLSLSRAR